MDCPHYTAAAVRHSSALRREMVALVDAGVSYLAVWKIHGVPLATIHRWVHTDLARPPVRRQSLSPAKRAAIEAEIDSARFSNRQIARIHGVDKTTVAKIRDSITVGGVAPRPHRCVRCRALILTRRCLRCEPSAVFSSSRSSASSGVNVRSSSTTRRPQNRPLA
jgi:transposase-like protein